MSYSDHYIGEIIAWSGMSIPAGWKLCDGSALRVDDYPELYSIIGNNYGGDNTIFSLPHLCGRIVVGVSPQKPLGSTGGSSTVQLTAANLPAHNHGFIVANENASSTSPSDCLFANITDPGNITCSLDLDKFTGPKTRVRVTEIKLQ